MLGFLTQLFGNKKDRDVKTLQPIVGKVAAIYAELGKLTDDQLRERSFTLRKKIRDFVASYNEKINQLRHEASENPDVARKEELYAQADKLKKERNEGLEKLLLECQPEAFAIVKDTSRRLTQNGELRVRASEWDKWFAQNRPHVVLDNEFAVWKNTWNAAGNEVKWDMIHYDVQLMGGSVLHQGKIAEMATGEGKTLVSTLPAFLNGLTGLGVHVVTVNDYLARRDCEWNAPIFEFHGLSVDCIDRHEPNSEQRRRAYMADITYGTNNEFGFDYLRDNMTTHPEHLVQREHHYAIVDEIDSVLIDEARTPLIISGPVPQGEKHEFHQLKPRIQKLVDAQKKVFTFCLNEAKKLIEKGDTENGGFFLLRAHRGLPKNTALIKYLSEPGIKSILTKTENFYLQDNQKQMPKVDVELFFTIDEKNNSIELTDKGRDLITESGEDPNFFVIPDLTTALVEIDRMHAPDSDKLRLKEELATSHAEKSERLHTISQLLKAYCLFEKDVEYIVQDGKVLIVDEQTGRVLPGRRYSDGLHQAIEAKENVKVEALTQTYATITLQNYFRMYHKLAGMTGTAETEAEEFYEIYKLDVVGIPTHRAIIRKDENDLVYRTKREKYNAVIEEIEKLVNAGRPVLVGTTSVEVSELLSRMLTMRKVKHNVLNAKLHQREAEIVAEAGQSGTVTIATNMAGRGTDIKLGPGVKEAGGLAIIGTERHESRRVDRQLRGRAGRQGDPGSSQFFVSLEDDLMRLFGSERISKVMDRLGMKEGEVIQHSMITNSITNAQKKVEENNFGMRKRLLEYDDVMSSQRDVIYRRRRNALFGDRIKIDIDNMTYDFIATLVKKHYEVADSEGLRIDCLRYLGVDPEFTDSSLANSSEEKATDLIYDLARKYYTDKTIELSTEVFQGISRIRANVPQAQVVEIIFTDGGNRKLRLLLDIQQVIDSEGRSVPDTLEKAVTLGLIDDKWKNHLREMDELRTNVQSAVYEQKDPLLVYKLESYALFQQMLAEINQAAVTMIYKAEIDAPEKQKVSHQHEEKRDDFSRLKTKHEDATEVQKDQQMQHLRQMQQNRGQAPVERPVSRAERREIERKNKKK